jgi:rod shape determining protein RodA
MKLIDKKQLKNIDYFMLALIFVIVCCGFVFITNACSPAITGDNLSLGEVLSQLNLHYAFLQALWFVIGLILIFVILLIDYRSMADFSKILYIGIVGLMVVLLVAGKTTRGVAAWIDFGERGFQPAELCKIAVIIACSKYAATAVERDGSLKHFKDIALVCGIALVPVILAALQPDWGTAFVYICILVGILFASRISLKYVLTGLGLITVVAPIAYYFLMNDDQRSRIIVFLNPEAADSSAEAYQVTQSKLAIGSSGLTGKGLFKEGSLASLDYVPDRHTDFIFAVTVEAVGFIGGLILILLYFTLILRALYIATKARDKFGYLMVVGVVAMFTFHVIENIGMTMGVLPITGIPLPFMSYGGSSMLTNMIAFGIVLNVSMRRQTRL